MMKVSVWIVFACFVAGCSDCIIALPESGIKLTIPKRGSTFYYDSRVGSTSFRQVVTVDSVGAKLFGKENVVIFRNRVDNEPSSSKFYLAYESNGDISEFYEAIDPANDHWITYPIASQTPIIVPTMREPWTPGYLELWQVLSLVKNDPFILGADTLDGFQIEHRRAERVFDAKDSILRESTRSTYITWSPEIGQITQFHSYDGQSHRVLTAYQLK
jgi:hypothetical protein